MNPEEKAKELLEKFEDIKTLHLWAEYENNNILLINQAKICALIAVDEIIGTKLLKVRNCGFIELNKSNLEYWEQVKQEINKL